MHRALRSDDEYFSWLANFQSGISFYEALNEETRPGPANSVSHLAYLLFTDLFEQFSCL